MDQSLELLIQKYEKHLASGMRNLSDLELSNNANSAEYRTQKLLIRVWKMILKDFKSLSDKYDDDYTKKVN